MPHFCHGSLFRVPFPFAQLRAPIYFSIWFLPYSGRFTSETRLLLSKGGLDSSEFAGHSFRIGAATTAASANLPPWLIKVLGRWSSDCFERYIKTPPSVLAQVPQTLRSHRPVVIQLCSFYSNIIMF